MITFILFFVAVVFVVATIVMLLESSPANALIAAVLALVVGSAWYDRAFAPPPPLTAEQVAQREENRRAEEALRVPQQLSEADGCVVFKFKDNGYWHYFTRCDKDVTTDSTRTTRVGKSNQTKIETIVTQR